ncbi:MAG: LysR family transcriptional regulator [Dehalococcoidia bacterium]
MEGVDVRLKLWLEKDGNLVFSDYRAALLRQIKETGSLAEAAERMGLSYRRAWGKVREIEGNLGGKLIESARGGAGGGRTRLTPLGERMLKEFDDLLARATTASGAETSTYLEE